MPSSKHIAVLSSRILRFGFNYARIMNVLSFKLDTSVTVCCSTNNKKNLTTTMTARESFWYKCCCLTIRFLVLIAHICILAQCSLVKDQFLNVLSILQTIACFVIGLVIILLQFWYNKTALIIFNRFLRLFRRLRVLEPRRRGKFGDMRVFVFLVLKLVCTTYEIYCYIPDLLADCYNPVRVFEFCIEIYLLVGSSLLLDIGVIGFLSVGVLYDEVNSYVQHELHRQLRSLDMAVRQRNEFNIGRIHALFDYDYDCHKRSKVIARQMDECAAIYAEIQSVGKAFDKLLELPLCLCLLCNFSSIALMLYYILVNKLFHVVGLWVYIVKVFNDVVLLTLSVHFAVSSSRIVQRLSLESAYITEDKAWNMKLEIFLNRLNFYEFRVKPLGLFEVSNEIILLFLSGLITYMTYIVQSALQANQI